ncbi:unnamed protein product [Schistosoma margrebowiei]|uniref:Secreted protein n=1 Tax=Schistosoma margrebowiei TaxID=48269 RepID=A0A3P8DKH8_9TREM|nr:unnamed protein product [Schistosoma margrebowiei]
MKRMWSTLAVAATSAFSACAGMLSGPAALPLLMSDVHADFFNFLCPTSVGRSVGDDWIFVGFFWAGRFKSSLKCSSHLLRCSSMLVITLPSLLFIDRSGVR